MEGFYQDNDIIPDTSNTKAKIMLVTERVEVSERLQGYFQGYALGVHVFKDEGSALEALKAGEFNIVVYNPDKGGDWGVRFMEKVKRLDPNIEVIYLTEVVGMEERWYALTRGAFEYLPLGVRKEELLRAVGEAWHQYGLNISMARLIGNREWRDIQMSALREEGHEEELRARIAKKPIAHYSLFTMEGGQGTRGDGQASLDESRGTMTSTPEDYIKEEDTPGNRIMQRMSQLISQWKRRWLIPTFGLAVVVFVFIGYLVIYGKMKEDGESEVRGRDSGVITENSDAEVPAFELEGGGGWEGIDPQFMTHDIQLEVIGDYTCNGINVNIREGPGLVFPSLGHINKGQKVYVNEMIGSWYGVESEEVGSGFVYHEYLCPDTETGNIYR